MKQIQIDLYCLRRVQFNICLKKAKCKFFKIPKGSPKICVRFVRINLQINYKKKKMKKLYEGNLPNRRMFFQPRSRHFPQSTFFFRIKPPSRLYSRMFSAVNFQPAETLKRKKPVTEYSYYNL